MTPSMSGGLAAESPEILRVQDVPVYRTGPILKKLKNRTLTIWIVIGIIGLIPWLLTVTGVRVCPPQLIAAGFSLLMPGAGLLATGNLFCIALGILIYYLYTGMGLRIWMTTGIQAMRVWLWILSIIGAVFTAHRIPVYGAVLAFALVVYTIVKKVRFNNMVFRGQMALRGKNMAGFDAELQEYRDHVKEAQPFEERELSEDAVKAVRYIFDMSLREPGDFSGFDSIEQCQLNALRYHLDYIGYALTMLQCTTTPNFHGYLNKAQQWVIESLTRPESVGYWKWERLGALMGWNPDPIPKFNIMFTGWSSLPIVLYGANTRDLRYEQEGALKFRTSKRSARTYDYSVNDILAIMKKQFGSYVTKMFPCEPYWVFPSCNGYGIDAVLASDAQHHTEDYESLREDIEEVLRDNFMMPSGAIAPIRNTLYGLDCLSALPPKVVGDNTFSCTKIWNPINHKIALRSYIIGRMNNIIRTEDGIRSPYGEWKTMLDTGNYKMSPGYAMGFILAGACEMGDAQVIEEILKAADENMERCEDPDKYYYPKASVTGNVLIANARYAQKDDFRNMILHGPGEDALRGPILETCSYPEVLVARARSHGEDLDLVLYNGTDEKDQQIGIERLKPGAVYEVSTGGTITADKEGKASLMVHIDGRTPILIRPAA